MSRGRRTAIGWLGAAVLVIAVIVVAVVTLALMTTSQATSKSETNTTTSSTTNSATSSYGNASTIRSNVTNGLQLVATISPTDSPSGTNISVAAQVYNTLPTQVVVNATSIDNPADGPCQQGLASGVEAYQGTYTSANISSAEQLTLYNPSLPYLCPAAFTFTYTFSPNSDNATFEAFQGGNGPIGKNTVGPVKETSILAGYWTGSGQNYTFHTFPQGKYTVVVFDVWKQSAIGYFQVGNGIASSSTTTSSSSYSTTHETTSAASTMNSPGDLRLGLVVSSPVQRPDIALINVSEYNTAPTHDNVTKGDLWPAQGLSAGSCEGEGSSPYPYGIAVYQGTYSLANLSAATRLSIFDSDVPCPAIPQIFWYDFQPNSVNASVRLSWAGDTYVESWLFSTSIPLTGYYNQSSGLAPFPPGSYTVLAGDEWGASAIVYFQVAADGHVIVSDSSNHSTGAPQSLVSSDAYGAWNYSASLSASQMSPGQNVTATFTLKNTSNQTQRVDVDNPLVLPTIYSLNGTVVWAFRPPSYNAIENVTASQVLSTQMTLPTYLLKPGQSYVLSTSPGIGTPGFVVNFGPDLQVNQTITVLSQ
jgi:hypothetical protein